MMKAVVQREYGSIDNLCVEEVARPVAAEGEVLVRVHAASVHPDVWHVVCAQPRVVRVMGAGFMRPKNPIPGTDVAGVVEEVGQEVTAFKKGDEVFGETINNFQWIHGGAFAEYVAVKENSLSLKPKNVSFEQAAVLPTSMFIVYMNLEGGSLISEGTTVLINGAGGGVGSLALQLIKAWGGVVTAVDCASKRDMLRELGADRVVDYEVQSYLDLGEEFDILFDIPGNHSLKERLKAIKPGGKYVPIGHDNFGKGGKSTFGMLPHFISFGFRGLFNKKLPRMNVTTPSKKEVMELAQRHLADGSLTPKVGPVFPMSEARQAMRCMIQENPNGKVMIAIREL